MTILLNKKLTLTEDSNSFIQQYIDYVQTVDPRNIYECLTDKQILKNKFIFQIYQLKNLDLANISLDSTTNQLNIMIKFWNSTPIKLGSLTSNDQLKQELAAGAYPTLKITGGNYKKVVTDEYGDDQIQDFFEPYNVVLELHEADTINYQSKKIDTAYHYAFKSENSLISLAKILMRCFAVFGLLLGLGFMFVGFFLTGLMVIIAFFGVNSYTLLLADSHMQTQRQQAN